MPSWDLTQHKGAAEQNRGTIRPSLWFVRLGVVGFWGWGCKRAREKPSWRGEAGTKEIEEIRSEKGWWEERLGKEIRQGMG